MANSLILNTIYNQYLTTYAPNKSDTRFDTHKRSELKGITNSMARVNKDAPLYKIDSTPDARKYIIGMKEESRMLQNTISSVMGNAGTVELDGKIAYSSNENIATAKYVGSQDNTQYESADDGQILRSEGEIPTYEVEVQSMATSQVNIGDFLNKETLDIAPGDYSFDLNVGGQGYEFQYTIRPDDTNYEVQSRLSRLINNSNIHLSSSVIEDGEGNSSLKIESAQVGIHFGESSRAFEITDNGGSGSGSVEYLGIDYVAREASNAHFTVNGVEAESASNTFILEKNYEITLNGVTAEGDGPITIGVKPNTEAAVENINNLIGGYNRFVKTMSEYRDKQTRSNGLVQETGSIAKLYAEGMGRMGINIAQDGTLEVDEEKLRNSIVDEDSELGMTSLRDFSGAMLRKAKQVSLNPVSYVDKTVVEYKNPGKTFLSPYVASAYAGMMFNSYC